MSRIAFITVIFAFLTAAIFSIAMVGYLSLAGHTITSNDRINHADPRAVLDTQ